VFAFGGHDDLPRVLTYLCTGIVGGPPIGPCQEMDLATVQGPPHDYGVAVVLLNVADHLVPAEQVAPLRDAVRRFLWASSLAEVDAAAAEREFAALRGLPATLPEPAATLLVLVNNRDADASILNSLRRIRHRRACSRCRGTAARTTTGPRPGFAAVRRRD
jgi:hypothetical protein